MISSRRVPHEVRQKIPGRLISSLIRIFQRWNRICRSGYNDLDLALSDAKIQSAFVFKNQQLAALLTARMRRISPLKLDFTLSAANDLIWCWLGFIRVFSSCLLTAGAAGERKGTLP